MRTLGSESTVALTARVCALLALFLAACTDPLAGVTGIAVTVRPCGDGPTGVDQIQLTLSPASGAPEAQSFDVAGHDLPVRVTATLPADGAGRYGVEVAALGSGQLLATGREEVQVTAGQVEPVIVQLCGTGPDGGPGPDATDGPGLPDGGDGPGDGPPAEGPPDLPVDREVEVDGDAVGPDRTGGDDPPACGSGRLLCGDDCLDVTGDPENCGACGHSCRGSTCTAGRCDPERLADLQPEPSALAVSGGSICWANRGTAPDYTDGQVRCRDAHGAAAMPSAAVASNLVSPLGISLAGREVFWVEAGPTGSTAEGRVRGSSITDPMPFELSAQDAVPRGIATDGLAVFWVDSASPFRVRSASLVGREGGLDVTGSGATQAGTNPRAVAVDGTHVYWVAESAGTTSGSLRRVPLTGGAVEVLKPGLSQPRALALTETHVLVATWGSTDAAVDGSVLRVAKEGSREVEVLAGDEPHPVAVAVAGGQVYWASAGAFQGSCSCYPAGTVKRVGLDDGSAEVVLAEDQAGLVALDIDDQSLYWANAGGGQVPGSIWRLAR